MTRNPSAAFALLTLCSLVRPQLGLAQTTAPITIAPPSSAAVQAYTIPLSQEAVLTDAQKLALIKQNIKYVFVLFQENRSFDFYFGTYPGANGLFSQPAAQTPGFTQTIVNTDGTLGTRHTHPGQKADGRARDGLHRLQYRARAVELRGPRHPVR